MIFTFYIGAVVSFNIIIGVPLHLSPASLSGFSHLSTQNGADLTWIDFEMAIFLFFLCQCLSKPEALSSKPESAIILLEKELF